MGLLQAAAMLSHANTCTGEIGDDVAAHSVNDGLKSLNVDVFTSVCEGSVQRKIVACNSDDYVYSIGWQRFATTATCGPL
ncbi:MAG: hypothetical protein C4K48_07900 [Candidatus Thorarchaeota archaeon]|nr:MAG: hypothetical protein C4K48_07900 [Candidatus Thorarchaeota archaeon]